MDGMKLTERQYYWMAQIKINEVSEISASAHSAARGFLVGGMYTIKKLLVK